MAIQSIEFKKISCDTKMSDADAVQTYVDDSIRPVKSAINNLAWMNIGSLEPGDCLRYNNGKITAYPTINNDIWVCMSEAERAACIENKIKFDDIIKNWKTFCHSYENNKLIYEGINSPATNTDLTWYYNEDTFSIDCTDNIAKYSGFVSDRKYSSYDMVVQCGSTSVADDDFISIVACFAEEIDPNTNKPIKQHTLSFFRSPYNNISPEKCRWSCIVDAQFGIANDQTNGDGVWAPTVKDNVNWSKYGQFTLSALDVSTDSDEVNGGNWNEFGDGVLVRISRSGNVIRGWTTPFKKKATNLNPDDLTAEIVIDLDQLIADYISKNTAESLEKARVLKLFTEKSSIGYGAISQAQLVLKNIKFVTDVYPVVMIKDNKIDTVYIYDFIAGNWTEDNMDLKATIFKPGQMSYNSKTSGIYFMTGDGNVNCISIPSQTSLDKLEEFLDLVVKG